MSLQDHTYDEESLRSKYIRLCIEFKKIREKHRLLKDSYKESTERISHLESKLTDNNIHVRNLEHERESLLFRNQYLIKQATFLEKQLEAANQKRGNPSVNGYSVDGQLRDDALKNALAEVHNLHEDLVSQSSQFLARITELESANSQISKRQCVSKAVQTSAFPNLSPFTQSSSSVEATSSSLNALCFQDMVKDASQNMNNASALTPASSPGVSVQGETLRNPPFQGTSTVIATSHTTSFNTEMSPRKHSLPAFTSVNSSSDHFSPREKCLLERISQLEGNLAEISLKQRLESRRNQLSQQKGTRSESNDSLLYSPARNELVTKEKLLVEYYEAQLHDRTKQLALCAGRIADANAEIRSLYEHLRCSQNESERQRREISAALAKTSSLEQELESTKQHAAEELTQMAQHLALLTDDLHALRGVGGRNTTSPASASANSASKNSFLSSLLKRNSYSIDFFSPSSRDNSMSREESR